MRLPTIRERALCYLKKNPGIRHMGLVKWLTEGRFSPCIRMDDALHEARNIVTLEYAQAVSCGDIGGQKWRVLYLTEEGFAEYKRLYRRRTREQRKRVSRKLKMAHQSNVARKQAITHAKFLAAAEAEKDKMVSADVTTDMYRSVLADDAGDATVPASAETDPLIWIKEAKPNIQDKRKGKGLVPFEPWDYQEHIIKMVVRGQGFVIDKSRQTGVTTAIMVAYAWLLLYGRPFHGHAIANKESVVIKVCLKKTRRALETAYLTEDQRVRLNLGGEGGTEFSFKGKFSENYIRGHAASPDAGHSFDGTHVLMDECARMPFTEDIYNGLQNMLDEGAGFLGIVSTYNGSGDFFCNAVENAEGMGLKHFPLDWRAHPQRDQAWWDRKLAQAEAADDVEGLMEQHALSPKGTGQQVFDIMAIERLAASVKHLGKGYKDGHRYAIGIDQATGGAGKHIACVIDITATPPQVVEMRVFKPKIVARAEGDHDAVVKQRIAFIEKIAKEYPGGKVYIDATTEKAVAALAKIPSNRKRAVHSTGGQSSQAKETFDPGDRLWWLHLSRKVLLSWGVAVADLGRCVIHVDKFPALFRGLKTAHPTNKDKGKNVDELDAFLHAAIPLRRERKKRSDERRDERVPASDQLQGITRQRW